MSLRSNKSTNAASAAVVVLGLVLWGAVASHGSTERGQHPASIDQIGNIKHQPLRSSFLSVDMTLSQVRSIMGEPTGRKAFADAEVVRFDDEGIEARVTFLDNRLVGVSLDLAHIVEAALPRFARLVKPGMTRGGVALLLGEPVEDRRWESPGVSLEQMVFRPGSNDTVSVLLADGLVVGVLGGDAVPGDLLQVTLPSDPKSVETDALSREVQEAPSLRIGVTLEEARAIYGEACQAQDSSFKGVPVQYLLYELQAGSTYLWLTFTGGALTEFHLRPQQTPRDLGDTLAAVCGSPAKRSCI